ncbi:MAG TPA: energy transducer TonB [Candidatus Sulfotelmatobacter sp.]|nr:energy transducer TonB [Candidatus Sulfotelmatobacter sp.]
MVALPGGPQFHFDLIDHRVRTRGAQTFSAGLHVVIIATLFFAIASAPTQPPLRTSTLYGLTNKLLPYLPPPDSSGHPSLGRSSGGGEQDPRPTRSGNLALFSSMPLAPPRLNRNPNVALPAPPAVLDPNAPASVATVTNLSLPWMKSDTDSAGPGRGHGFGNGEGGGMGDNNGSGAGVGDDAGPYANVASPVTCLYCPEPGYTEEARKAKLQGKLLLEVLVGADGRATRIRVLQGLGLGLDELAAAAIRSWRFSPAHDANKRPVPAWVTVETHFQLY